MQTTAHVDLSALRNINYAVYDGLPWTALGGLSIIIIAFEICRLRFGYGHGQAGPAFAARRTPPFCRQVGLDSMISTYSTLCMSRSEETRPVKGSKLLAHLDSCQTVKHPTR
jgi:hypothetical protein